MRGAKSLEQPPRIGQQDQRNSRRAAQGQTPQVRNLGAVEGLAGFAEGLGDFIDGIDIDF